MLDVNQLSEKGCLRPGWSGACLVHLRCRFGGTRAFGPGDGIDCGRRMIKLHLSRRHFLCQHCNQLAYASQYEESCQRALRRANKLKQRLGIGVGIDEPFPVKPKGMWARTYGRLLMRSCRPR
jgi:hypothetical protein